MIFVHNENLHVSFGFYLYQYSNFSKYIQYIEVGTKFLNVRENFVV
jgi:hypothetical protein